MKVIQVVGFKDSGKTSMVEALVKYFSEYYRIATVKHHGSHHPMEYNRSVDHIRHYEQGSEKSVVISQDEILTIEKNKMNDSNEQLDSILSKFESESYDIAIVEGFKESPYLKVWMASKIDHRILHVEPVEWIVYYDEIETLSARLFEDIFERSDDYRNV